MNNKPPSIVLSLNPVTVILYYLIKYGTHGEEIDKSIKKIFNTKYWNIEIDFPTRKREDGWKECIKYAEDFIIMTVMLSRNNVDTQNFHPYFIEEEK